MVIWKNSNNVIHFELNRISDLSVKCSEEPSPSNLSCSFQHFTAIVKIQLSLASHLNLKLLCEQVNNDVLAMMKLTAVACLCVSPFLE